MKLVLLIILIAVVAERFGNFRWEEQIKEKKRELGIKNKKLDNEN